MKPKSPRFKDTNLTAVYNKYVNVTHEQIREMVLHPGSNWDQAFRAGYVGYRLKCPRNVRLYAVYVAGKEWMAVNASRLESKG